jgi:hypothetical protein
MLVRALACCDGPFSNIKACSAGQSVPDSVAIHLPAYPSFDRPWDDQYGHFASLRVRQREYAVQAGFAENLFVGPGKKIVSFHDVTLLFQQRTLRAEKMGLKFHQGCFRADTKIPTSQKHCKPPKQVSYLTICLHIP